MLSESKRIRPKSGRVDDKFERVLRGFVGAHAVRSTNAAVVDDIIEPAIFDDHFSHLPSLGDLGAWFK